ncbi:MAG: YqgE/AlgH family protein [Gammaproteobacteria bacterium]|nr:YqgE/AlgH family protein [Gammaproteobacteria bacterium]
MSEHSYLTDHFLIAMPSLADPNFSHTVTYLCEHNAEGALGIVINRPSEMQLGDILEQLDIDVTYAEIAQRQVVLGGPVERERGFVLHRPLGEWEVTLRVTDELGVTASRDVLAAIARGEGPRDALVALGYAGWGAGQLEQEMAANAWLSGPADAATLFETPMEQRWTAAAARMGVDLSRLTDQTGHA